MALAMMLVGGTANAQYTVPEENSVLQSETYHMRLFKNVDFAGLTINGAAIKAGTISFDTNLTTDEIKYNGYSPYRCTTEGLSMVWCATSTPTCVSGEGIKTNGSGPRGFFLSEMKKGQIIVLQGKNGGYNTGGTNTEYNGFCVPNGSRYSSNTNWEWELFDPLQVEDISNEIHVAQDQAARDEGTIGEEETAHDNYLYLRVLQDGWVSLPMERAATVNGFQIWIDADAAEEVSAPTLQVVSVKGDAREVLFNSGTSTFGSEVFTYYTKDGTDPVYLKESEEVEAYVVYDEDGITVLRTYTVEQYENSEISPEDATLVTPLKKKVLDLEKTFGGSLENIGTWDYDSEGDCELFDPENGSIQVDANDDEDEDNIVILKAVSVSATGGVSQIVDLPVDVSVIVLNQPTLTWVGFDGLKRTYKVGWTSNLKNDEEYTITYVGDGGSIDGEVAIGDVISFEQEVTVTVSAGGAYDDGVLVKEADNPGIEITRKVDVGQDETGAPLHDWDFQNLSADVLAKINGEIIDYYVKKDEDGNEVFRCSEDEYKEKQLELEEYGDGDPIPSELMNYVDMQPVQVYYGWDAADSRNSNRHWRTWIPTYDETDGTTIISSVYEEEQTGLFHDLVVDNSHASYSTMAIFKDGSGLYFMSKGSVQILPVEYGEYIVVTTNNGTTVYTADTDVEGYTFDVNSAVYLYSIDIYTYQNLPEPPETIVGIEGVKDNKAESAVIYNLAGQRVDNNYKGIVIKNGKKVLVK